MEPTRRFYSVAMLGVATTVLALLFSDILLLGIPLGIGLWVLIHQIAFAQTLGQIASNPPLTQGLAPNTILVDDTTILTVELDDKSGLLQALNTQVTVRPPVALDTTDALSHALTEPTQTLTISLQANVAGTYSIRPPTIECTSRRGLFRESIHVGNECTVTAEPQVPRSIHVGTGGQQIAVAYGEHDAQQGGAGFEPGELREYYPGDPTNRIDWNATARLDDPYVREFKAETIRQTQLVVDTREHMTAGPRGQTKLDYAREVAVSLTDYVAGLEDPLGVMLVDDDHVTGPVSPVASTQQYKRVRRHLIDLSTAADTTTATRRGATPNHAGGRATFKTGREAQRIVANAGDDAYSQTLTPYFEDVEAYVQRLTEQPLYQSVNERLNEGADSWLVVVTDDSNRAEVLETARAAAIQGVHVSVFLLPSVLFSEGNLADLEASYDDYVDFESFRQQLASINNVDAFEVGPDDRISALLETARPQERTI